MATILKAGNATTGLSLTPDNTGILELKTGTGSGTTAVTISTAQVVSVPGNLSFNSGYGSSAVAYGCRAWVNFDGTGTVAIRASGNVTSITDNATGDYTVNFTTAMPDANYAIVGTAGYTSNGTSAGWLATNRIGASGNESAPTTTSCRINGVNQAGSVFDTKYMQVSIFR